MQYHIARKLFHSNPSLIGKRYHIICTCYINLAKLAHRECTVRTSRIVSHSSSAKSIIADAHLKQNIYQQFMKVYGAVISTQNCQEMKQDNFVKTFLIRAKVEPNSA